MGEGIWVLVAYREEAGGGGFRHEELPADQDPEKVDNDGLILVPGVGDVCGVCGFCEGKGFLELGEGWGWDES